MPRKIRAARHLFAAMASRFFLVLLTLLIAVLGHPALATTPTLVADDQPQIALAGHLEVFFDESDTLTLEQIMTRHDEDFVDLAGNLSAGFTRRTAWLRFRLARDTLAPITWLLELRPSFIDDLRLYTPRPDGGYQERLAGDQRPFATREIPVRDFIFAVEAPRETGARHEIYLRVSSQNALLLEPVLWQPLAYAVYAADQNLTLGLLFGILLVAIAGNLVYAAQLRDTIYLHYAAYVTTFASMLLFTSGIYSQYVFADAPQWADRINLINLALMQAIAFNLMWAIIELHRHLPRVFRVYRAIAWGGCVLALALIPFVDAVRLLPVIQVVLITSLLVNLIIAAPLAWRGVFGARFYLAAFGIVIAGGIVRILRNFGMLPANALTEHALTFAMLVHVLLISVLVGRQVSRLRAERDGAQCRALAAARRNEEELTMAVAERTQQLQSANARAEEALVEYRQFTQDQRHFLSMLSHEVRTPLAVINSAAQITAISAKDSSPLLERQMSKIRRNVRRLSDLIDVCLADERISVGGWELKRTPVALRALAEEVVTQARGAATDHHLLWIDGKELPESFNCDRELMFIVLNNLLDNAVKYSPNGGSIRLGGRLEAGADGPQLLLEVLDQGPGVPPEMRKMIFERFVRGHHGGGIPGAGLGLSLVKRIVELHGGTVAVDSAGVSGARFRLRFPYPGALSASEVESAAENTQTSAETETPAAAPASATSQAAPHA